MKRLTALPAHARRADPDKLRNRQASLAAQTMSVRSNAAFVGLNKIREPLAFQAALKATGFEGISGFAVPPAAGEPTHDVQELVDRAFEAAVAAATMTAQPENPHSTLS